MPLPSFSVPAQKSPGATDSTTAELLKLNDGYIQAFLKSDVAWYREHLADDFICIDTDGSTLDKQAFLKDAAAIQTVFDFHLEEFGLRVYGDAALLQAISVYTRKDGSKARNRYTDVWIRRDGKWKTVTAQITPVTVSAH
jgi:ketosteroid isomerase-like protein